MLTPKRQAHHESDRQLLLLRTEGNTKRKAPGIMTAYPNAITTTKGRTPTIPRVEEPPDGITKADFLAFQERTKTMRDEASSIPFKPWPAWFDTSIGVVVKATFMKPGEMIKRGGVVSNGNDKWFFLHSSNLKDLSGLGFMLTEDMLPFLYYK